MLNLDQVTLLCVETRSPEMAMFAINKCTANIQFRKIVLVTDLNIPFSYPKDVSLIKTPVIKTTEDYSNYLLSDLNPLIEGSHVLIIQWDSFVIRPEMWDDEFLKYDYIGAPWPHHPETPVGNGGFSLRSKKLISALQNPEITKKHPEDQSICIDNKAILEEKFEIHFAPIEIAQKFAIERGSWRESFGFHGMFNFANALEPKELEKLLLEIPSYFLGGIDTYDLIDSLIEKKEFKLAKLLLKRTQPKKSKRGKLMRLHFKCLLKTLLN